MSVETLKTFAALRALQSTAIPVQRPEQECKDTYSGSEAFVGQSGCISRHLARGFSSVYMDL